MSQIEDAVVVMKRNDELVEKLNAFETQNRMLKAQLNAAEVILKHTLIDNPISMDIATKFGMGKGAALRRDKEMWMLYERIKLLENDAWTATTLGVKDFVKSSREFLTKYPVDVIDQSEEVLEPRLFLDVWVTKFEELLK